MSRTQPDEPIQATRQAMGFFVIGFLLILLIFAWLMKREFWKDVHCPAVRPP